MKNEIGSEICYNFIMKNKDKKMYYLLIIILIVLSIFVILLALNYTIKIYGPKASPQGVMQQTIFQSQSESDFQSDCQKIAGWTKYIDKQWNFSLMYPENYQIKYDSSSWPNSIIHFQDKALSEKFLGRVEYWEAENEFYSQYYKEPKFIIKHPQENIWITIDYIALSTENLCENYEQTWQRIIDSFTFIQ